MARVGDQIDWLFDYEGAVRVMPSGDATSIDDQNWRATFAHIELGARHARGAHERRGSPRHRCRAAPRGAGSLDFREHRRARKRQHRAAGREQHRSGFGAMRADQPFGQARALSRRRTAEADDRGLCDPRGPAAAHVRRRSSAADPAVGRSAAVRSDRAAARDVRGPPPGGGIVLDRAHRGAPQTVSRRRGGAVVGRPVDGARRARGFDATRSARAPPPGDRGGAPSAAGGHARSAEPCRTGPERRDPGKSSSPPDSGRSTA